MDGPADARRCRCGTRIARDNAGNLCARCVKEARVQLAKPPAVPPEFWHHPDMQQALATWHMGKVIRAFRCHPWHGKKITQTVAASWFFVNQTQLSRDIEGGPPVEDMAKLRRWAHVLGIPPELLWFKLPERDEKNPKPAAAARPEANVRRAAASPNIPELVLSTLDLDEVAHVRRALDQPRRFLDDAVITAFNRQLNASMRDDGALGPTSTLPNVLGLLHAIEQAALEVTPEIRRTLLSLGARGAEFAGWLYRDQTQPRRAVWWYDRAMEWAQEARDLPMQGYVLLKKSQMAYDDRNAVQVSTMAEAALEGPWQLPSRVRAEVTQQAALGIAMIGSPIGEVERALNAARELLDGADQPNSGPGELGTYFTFDTLNLRTASCFTEAGKPGRAADLFGEVLAIGALSRRDRGYFQARRAAALALSGEPDAAADLAVAAAEVAKATSSERTVRVLMDVLETLRPWSRRSGPRALQETLSATRSSS